MFHYACPKQVLLCFKLCQQNVPSPTRYVASQKVSTFNFFSVSKNKIFLSITGIEKKPNEPNNKPVSGQAIGTELVNINTLHF